MKTVQSQRYRIAPIVPNNALDAFFRSLKNNNIEFNSALLPALFFQAVVDFTQFA